MLVPAVKLCEWIAIKRVLGKGEAWAQWTFLARNGFFFFFLWKQKEQEGYAEILREKKIWPSVPVTGLLWHLRTITSSLPFYSYRTKFTKSFIHFCLFFFFFCFLLTSKIGNIQNTLLPHFILSLFTRIYKKNVRVSFLFVCFKFCIKKLCWLCYCLFSSNGCSMRGLHCFWNDSPWHRLKWHWDRGFHGTLTK